MEEKITINSLSEESFKKINKRINKLTKFLYCYFVFITGLIVIILINFVIKRKLSLSNISFENLLKIKYNLNNIVSKVNENIKEKQQKIIINYLQNQNYFCSNQSLFYNENFEKNIKIVKVNFEDKVFNMYIYNNSDTVSKHIERKKSWEKMETINILKALTYYSIKNNVKNENIYIIDIGANIGWYSILFGKYGFKVISFEPSKLNNYILNKNYCLNKDINIIIINKGLYIEEKKCYIYRQIENQGNGIVNCEKNKTLEGFLIPNKENEIILTKLSNYIPFFSDKNLVLLKIDIEGSEGKAIESGIELITKYHVPFIFLEFTPKYLRMYDTDAKQFLQLFIDNGYKISYLNFFDKNNYSIDEIMKRAKSQINLYIFYSKF